MLKRRKINNLKYIYIAAIKLLKQIFHFFGILYILEKVRNKSRFALWVRSLFAIYDLDEMIKLDLPWWTIKSSSKVEKFLAGRLNSSVFEWGAGASTLWLAQRAASVISVEHDDSWAARVNEATKDMNTVKIKHKPPSFLRGGDSRYTSAKSGNTGYSFENYVKAIDETGEKFDLIVIDGRAREACFDLALANLKEDGIVLFDNMNRKRYKLKLQQYEDQIEIIKTWGLTVALPYPSSTYLIKKKL